MTTEQKRLAAKLRKEYQWRANRYKESENGIRSNGGNCFNEKNARALLDSLEEQAEACGLDYLAIRREVYDTEADASSLAARVGERGEKKA